MENALEIYREQLARRELGDLTGVLASHGLALTEEDVSSLLELRRAALGNAGRVELGGGALPKLARAFCDSPYVDRQNFPTVLGELQDAFYYYKTECRDQFSDEELIEYMVRVFNGPAEGSAELLCGLSLEELCRWARNDGEIPFEEGRY